MSTAIHLTDQKQLDLQILKDEERILTLRQLITQDNIPAVERLLNSMRKENIQPNTRNCINLCTLCRSKQAAKLISRFFVLTDVPIDDTIGNQLLTLLIQHDIKNEVSNLIETTLQSENAFILSPTNLHSVLHLLESNNKVPLLLLLFQSRKQQQWTEEISFSLVQALMRLNEPQIAATTLSELISENIQPTPELVLQLLAQSVQEANPQLMKLLHPFILSYEAPVSTKLGKSIFQSYQDSGNIEAARDFFQIMQQTKQVTVHTYNGLIKCLIEHQRKEEAVLYYNQMRAAGIRPSGLDYESLLPSTSVRSTSNHSLHSKRPIGSTSYILAHQSRLLSKYRREKDFEQVVSTFDNMRQTGTLSAFAYGVVMEALYQLNQAKQSLQYFYKMQAEGFTPNEKVFYEALYAATFLRDLEEGKNIHKIMTATGTIPKRAQGQLILMYGMCGELSYAMELFHQMKQQCYLSALKVLMHHEQMEKAINYFFQVLEEDFEVLDKGLFLHALTAATKSKNYSAGARIHLEVNLRENLKQSTAVQNALIDMYGSCGSMQKSSSIFEALHKDNMHNAASYAAIMRSCVHSHLYVRALKHYNNLLEDGLKPTSGVFRATMAAAAKLKHLKIAKAIHKQMKIYGADMPTQKLLIQLYGACGDRASALRHFASIPQSQKNVDLWNQLIYALANQRGNQQAIQYFITMLKEGIEPNEESLRNIITSPGESQASRGVQLFDMLRRADVPYLILVANQLIEYHGKRQENETVTALLQQLLHIQPDIPVSSWNSAIKACNYQKAGPVAWKLFQQMQIKNCAPDEQTLLHVCRSFVYSKDLDNGVALLREMESKFGVQPKVDNFVPVLISLFFDDRLEDVKLLLNQIESQGDSLRPIMSAFLKALEANSDFNRADRLAEYMLTFYPHDYEANSYFFIQKPKQRPRTNPEDMDFLFSRHANVSRPTKPAHTEYESEFSPPPSKLAQNNEQEPELDDDDTDFLFAGSHINRQKEEPMEEQIDDDIEFLFSKPQSKLPAQKEMNHTDSDIDDIDFLFTKPRNNTLKQQEDEEIQDNDTRNFDLDEPTYETSSGADSDLQDGGYYSSDREYKTNDTDDDSDNADFLFDPPRKV